MSGVQLKIYLACKEKQRQDPSGEQPIKTTLVLKLRDWKVIITICCMVKN
jgi:hypothetical protein